MWGSEPKWVGMENVWRVSHKKKFICGGEGTSERVKVVKKKNLGGNALYRFFWWYDGPSGNLCFLV